MFSIFKLSLQFFSCDPLKTGLEFQSVIDFLNNGTNRTCSGFDKAYFMPFFKQKKNSHITHSKFQRSCYKIRSC
jgi:hypothetical protein